jgi:hypothetical protein
MNTFSVATMKFQQKQSEMTANVKLSDRSSVFYGYLLLIRPLKAECGCARITLVVTDCEWTVVLLLGVPSNSVSNQ